MSAGALTGFTVGVTADRRGDDQAVLLERLGVEVVRGPVLRTELDRLDGDLLAATRRLLAAPPDFLVANTGFGIRSWWARAATWSLDDELTRALAATRLVARGPKAAGALRSLGLPVWWRAPDEQLRTVGDRLIEEGIEGARVAVQLHGEDDRDITMRMRAAGAEVDEVPVYRWALPSDDRAAVALIRRCCEGSVDAVTFTAGPAVRQMVDLAEAEGLADPLLVALNERMVVVCVGPVCAAVAVGEGIRDPVVPAHWRLGAMVKTAGAALAARCWEAPSAGGPVVVRGGMVSGSGGEELLADPVRRGVSLLIARSGGPVPVEDLRAIGVRPDELAGAGVLAGAISLDADGVRLAGRPATVEVPVAAG